jgi:hypothetical protein
MYTSDEESGLEQLLDTLRATIRTKSREEALDVVDAIGHLLRDFLALGKKTQQEHWRYENA